MPCAAASSRSSGWRHRRTTRNDRSTRGSWPRWAGPIAGPSSRAETDRTAPARSTVVRASPSLTAAVAPRAWGRIGAPARPERQARRRRMDYGDYQHLTFKHMDHGVVLITINRPEVLNATNDRLHWELTQVWLTFDADPRARVAVVTGAGRAFSAGGDLDMVDANARDPKRLARTVREASDIVYNMINTDKPIVSAINGVAVGAGLVVALLADLSIISESAAFPVRHAQPGVGAGDHAAIVWPLLCGMAKAKYYLLTSDFIDGREAERIGLVSLCVPAEQLLPRAFEVADKLALGAQQAIRWTKRSLNNWLRMAGPIFDQSIALEMLTFMDEDVREGLQAIREKRPPRFPSARG